MRTTTVSLLAPGCKVLTGDTSRTVLATRTLQTRHGHTPVMVSWCEDDVPTIYLSDQQVTILPVADLRNVL